MKLLGVVLAGGKSTRMGSDKAMLPHPSGRSFLDHAVDRLSKVAAAVAVSGRVNDDSPLANIEDFSPSMGPAMAVYSSVLYASQNHFDSVIVTPVDMPALTADHLRLLVAASSTNVPTCAVFESEIPHPLVAVYPTFVLQELERLARSRQRSLRQWLSSRPYAAVPIESLALPDINTPDELAMFHHGK